MAFVQPGGRRFYYLDRGEPGNSAVLLLHGFNQTAHSWDDFAPRLAEAGFRVVAFDQRGHGESERPPDGDYGREAMADDVVRLADDLGIQRFSLVGMSMGAVHATLTAVRHPARVHSLVLVDWAPEVESAGVAAIAQIAPLAFDSFDDAVAAMHAFNPRRTRDNLRARLGHSMRQEADGRWRWKVDAAGLTAHPRFREPPESMWTAIGQVACSCLVIRGADSELLSAAKAEQVVARFRTAELITIPDASHSVAGDKPEEFYAAVAPFLMRTAR